MIDGGQNTKMLKFFRFNSCSYIKKLQEAVKGKAPKKDDDEATVNEYQIKLIALKTTSNISTLIRDLFHSPPIFRSVIQLSWITKKNNVSFSQQQKISIEKENKCVNRMGFWFFV